jgi:hypothetical protein
MRIAIFSLVIIILAAGPALAHRPGAMSLSPYFNFDAPAATAQKDPAPQVGDERTFWGWDLSVMPPTDRQFTATCRGVSDFGYVFVEDAHWDLDMNQSDVDAVLSAWDEATPAGSIDPGAGIYDIETELFGDPPDVDGWPGAVLLYYDVGCFMGTCFDGFYRYDDQLTGTYSNQMDMLHLELTQSDPGGEYMLGVTAHEFNHMLQMLQDQTEESWLSEALAEAAMIVTGYNDLGWLNDFTNNPDATFLGNDDEHSLNYGAALLLGAYLYEIGGTDLIQAVTADPANGATSIEDQLAAFSLGDSFYTFFGDLAAAIAADYFVDSGAQDAAGSFHFDMLAVGEIDWDRMLTDAPAKDIWEPNLVGGSMSAARIDLENDSMILNLSVDDPSGVLEVAVATVGDALTVSRFNSAHADWPNLSAAVDGAETVLVILANPELDPVSVSVDIDFDQEPLDDDADDDVDDDAGDDDAGDDANDDIGGGDDDDDDDGGGCCG